MMKRMVKIARMLMALGAILLTVVLGWQDRSLASEQTAKDCQSAEVLMTPHEPLHQEAVLTDATSLYRVCSSRPQRLLPTYGSKTERAVNPCSFVRSHIVKSVQFLHDSRRRQETAPFCLSASCLYYVIALRHIIR